MGIKRKRSTSDLTIAAPVLSPSPTSSLSESPNLKAGVIDPIRPLAPSKGWLKNWVGDISFSLNSRTRKRYRDNRPDEQSIYQYTIAKLFGAQKPRAPEATTVIQTKELKPTPVVHQPTLHSFWNIPPSRHDSPVSIADRQFVSQPSIVECEECFVTITNIQSIDDSLVIPFATDDAKCETCQRVVCYDCAVGGIGSRQCVSCVC